MSKEVEQRVVEMRFDNKQFEENAKGTISTLDKLKSALHLDGASKGLENVGHAAKNVDMSGLSGAVESVKLNFSALEVMGITALSNIANSAINAGKQLLSSFTIEPIRTGFQEYELKMNSVQTIMASTGESVDTVNKYLEELNKYSDQTIYSFSDMTSNIGKFTNAGVKLEDAVAAIKGISNEAAVSGANAQEASRAMYNFAQALSAGYVKLIDWKSIENANMATVEFKNQLLETALALGTVVKEGDKYRTTTTDAMGRTSSLFDATHSFNEALSAQWMTTEVLTETLKKYSDEQTDIGKKAYAAAQDVKTFSMMMDTLKEAAQSGWAQTWELIFGDIEQAKKLWTGVSNFFSDIIQGSAEKRNKLLGDALSMDLNPYKVLMDKLKGVSESINKVTESVSSAAKLEELGLTKEEIKMYRDLEKQAKETGVSIEELVSSMKSQDGRSLLIESFANIGNSIKNVFSGIKKAWDNVFSINPVQIYNLIKAFHDLTESLKFDEEASDKLRMTFEGLFNIFDLVFKLVNAPLKIAFKVLKEVLSAFDIDILDATASVGDMLTKFHDWILENEYIEKGIKKIAELIVVGIKKIQEWITVFKESETCQKIVENLTKAFNKASESGKNIIDGLTLGLKDGVNGLWNIVKNLATNILETIKNVLGIHSPSKKTYEVGKFTMEGFINGVKDFGTGAFDIVKSIFTKIVDFVKNLNIGNVIAMAFAGGLLYTAKKALDILGAFSSPFEQVGEILNVFKKSLKKVMKAKEIEIYSQVLLNFAKAIALLAVSLFVISRINSGKLWEAVGVIGVLAIVLTGMAVAISKFGKIKDMTKQLPIVGTILVIAIAMGLMAKAMKTLSGISKDQAVQTALLFAEMIAALVVMMLALTKLLKIQKGVGPKTIDSITNLLLKLSVSLLIMSVIAKIISGMSWGDMAKAAAGIGGLIVMIGLMLLTTKLVKGREKQISSTLLSISRAMLILTIVAKTIAKMSWGDMVKAAIGLLALIGIVALLIKVTNLTDGKEAKIGGTLLAISGCMFILTIVAKMISSMSFGDIIKAGVGLVGLVEIVRMLIKATNLAEGKEKKVAATLITVALCVGILAAVTVVLGMVSFGNLLKGIIAVGILSEFVKGLVESTKDAKDATGTIIALAVVVGIMGAVMVALSMMNPLKIAVAVIAIDFVQAMMKTLIKTANEANNAKSNIISMAILLGVMSAALITLSCLNAVQVLAAALALSATMLALSGAMKILSSVKMDITQILLTIAFVVGIAAALRLLAPALQQLSSMSLSEIGKGLLALAGVFVVIGLAAVVLGSVAPFIVLLSVAILALGVAMLSAGLGMVSFASGLIVLSTIGPNALANIASTVTVVAKLIPFVAKQIGLGIIEICKVLIDAVPVTTQLIATIITSLCDAIIQTVPKIGETIITVVTTICDVLITCVPKIIETAFTLFLAFLHGIEEHIEEITSTAIQIVVNFVNGISKKLPDVIDSAFKLIISFINGLADAIRNNSQAIYDAAKNLITALFDAMKNFVKNAASDFKELGKNIINGIKEGVKKSFSKIKDIAKDIGNSLLDGVKNILGIHSPSTEFAKIGMYSDEGLASGLKKYASSVTNSAKYVASEALNAMDGGLSGMSSLIEDAINGDPTIRPVLDLSNIESGARLINGMFGSGHTLELATSGGVLGIQNGGSGYVINMTINGAPGQDVNQLADLVSERINNSIQRRNNVWR